MIHMWVLNIGLGMITAVALNHLSSCGVLLNRICGDRLEGIRNLRT